jgi:hypothetical protein
LNKFNSQFAFGRVKNSEKVLKVKKTAKGPIGIICHFSEHVTRNKKQGLNRGRNPFHNSRLMALIHGTGKGIVEQGCQIVSFQTKYPKLGKFWKGLT